MMTLQARRDALTAACADGGPLFGVTVMLFGNQANPNDRTVPADLTPATFSGYGPAEDQVFGTPYIAEDGSVRAQIPSVQFDQTAATVTGLVWGFAVLNTAGTKVILAHQYAQPVSMNEAGDAVIVSPEIVWPEES